MQNKLIGLDLDALKKGGILKQRQKDYFILRTRIPGGYLKAEMLPKFLWVAKKYGRGYVHLSTRQCIEVPWIRTKDLEGLIKAIRKLGILKGACGPRTRNIVACPGTSVCRFGFLDTEKLAKKIDKEFFGKDVPKKFKIALSGCANSCAKPQENDLGFMAQAQPQLDLSLCTGCSLCAKVCQALCSRGRAPAAIIMGGDKRPVYRKEFCFFEGDCVRACPFDAWKIIRRGYAVFLGGKIGRFPMPGFKIAELVREGDLPKIIRKTIKAYNKIANKGERLAEAINRKGIEAVKKEIL